MGYAEQIRLERRFTKTIKSILGNYFIGQDVIHDQKEATDFEVFTVKPFKVGARLRTYSYFLRYPDEFTIRWELQSGYPTEIDKIRKGYVDYILYGFVDQDEKKIIQYFIGDLQVFRDNDPAPYEIHWNNPPDSALGAFRICEMPDSFILHKWQHDT